MRRTHGRILGAVAAILAAGLAGFSLRPSPRASATLAARNPAEIRTEVIRRTIHVVRRQHPARASGPRAAIRLAAGTAAPRGAGANAGSAAVRPVTTGASRLRAAGSAGSTATAAAAGAPAAVTTRTSASHAAAGATTGATAGATPAPASAPLTTRTSTRAASSGSAAAGSAGTSGKVTTRTSGAKRGGGDGGDHGD